MTQLPVIHSTLSPDALAKWASEQYQLDPESSGQLIKTGINHSYLIQSGKDKYVLRIYSLGWRTESEILEELNLLKLLHHQGISVSYPLADRNGQFIQTLEAPEGKRHAVLFSFAEGQKIQNFSQDLHFEIGRTMARMHQLTEHMTLNRVTYTPEILLDQSLASIRKFLPDDCPEMQFMNDALPQLKLKLKRIDPERLRKGVVHLDIWFDNLNIRSDGKITLFDFDFCGNGDLCLDIAYYVLQIHNTEKNVTDRTQKTNAFYQGYESIVPISEAEKQLIPMLGVCLLCFYLGIQCLRFDNWSNTFLNEVYLKRYITVFIKGYHDHVLATASH